MTVAHSLLVISLVCLPLFRCVLHDDGDGSGIAEFYGLLERGNVLSVKTSSFREEFCNERDSNRNCVVPKRPLKKFRYVSFIRDVQGGDLGTHERQLCTLVEGENWSCNSVIAFISTSKAFKRVTSIDNGINVWVWKQPPFSPEL